MNPYTIAGRVQDSNGNPIENATIYKSDPNGRDISRTYERTLSNKDGLFELKNLSQDDFFSVGKSGNILRGTAFKTYTKKVVEVGEQGRTPLRQFFTITLVRLSRADLLSNVQKAELGAINKGVISQIEQNQKRAEQRAGLMNNIQRGQLGAINKEVLKEAADKLVEQKNEENSTDASAERVTDETSGKILGMPKMVAIGLGVAILAIGGFFVYKKINKK